MEELAKRVAVYPAGRALPAVFFKSGFWPTNLPRCYKQGECFARFVALRPGGAEAIVFFDVSDGYLFEQDASGQWRQTAGLFVDSRCYRARQDLERGEPRVEPHNWPDLVIGDHHFVILPLSAFCQD